MCLIEVNRTALPTDSVEPFLISASEEIPLDLLVADVTPKEWEKINKDEIKLPARWDLKKIKMFSRDETLKENNICGEKHFLIKRVQIGRLTLEIQKTSLADCHKLYYLRATTEKLSKAALLQSGTHTIDPVSRSHKYLSSFCKYLLEIQSWRSFLTTIQQLKSLIRNVLPLAERIKISYLRETHLQMPISLAEQCR